MEADFKFTTDKDVSTANVSINTAGVEISTASPKFKIAGVSVDDVAAEGLVYIRRSAAKIKDKEALRLQEQFDEEERQRISSIHEEASTFKPEEWDNIQAQIEVGEELAHKLQAQERERYSKADKAKLLLGSSKIDVEQELNQESLKRQKIGEGSEPSEESKDKESDELSQEQLQQLMIIVPKEGMNVEALQTNYPIIDWEVYTEDLRMYWKIIRVGNHTEVYQIFKDMLKNFDKDDLIKL
ncbi:hypothetical protein Tco_1027248 [Tanacetum coccineum]